mgnify:CR=1 FL=1
MFDHNFVAGKQLARCRHQQEDERTPVEPHPVAVAQRHRLDLHVARHRVREFAQLTVHNRRHDGRIRRARVERLRRVDIILKQRAHRRFKHQVLLDKRYLSCRARLRPRHDMLLYHVHAFTFCDNSYARQTSAQVYHMLQIGVDGWPARGYTEPIAHATAVTRNDTQQAQRKGGARWGPSDTWRARTPSS